MSGANDHDITKIADLLDAVVITRPEDQEENLCLDAGYVGADNIVSSRGYRAHIRPRGEEIKESDRNPNYKPRRWIVEVAHSWFNRFRKIAPRYEKTIESCLGLHHLAAAIICFRKCGLS